MSEPIKLVNLRASILDLSAVTDLHGSKVVLQPKGMPGDTRECAPEVRDHHDVQLFLEHKWVAIQEGPAPQKLVSTPLPKRAAPPEPEIIRLTGTARTSSAAKLAAAPAPAPEPALVAAPVFDVEVLHQIQEPTSEASDVDTTPSEETTDEPQPEMTPFAGAEPATIESVEAALEEKDAPPEDAAPTSEGGKRKKKNR